MKNLLILVLLVCAQMVYGQGMLYTFTTFATEDYTSDTDTTMVFVNNESVCLFNKAFSYCDNILDHKFTDVELNEYDRKEGVYRKVHLRIETDAVPYYLMYVNNALSNVTLSDMRGEPIFLMKLFSTKEVDWTPSATRNGWSIVQQYYTNRRLR